MKPAKVLIIGGGMFGRAMQSLSALNGIPVAVVDQKEYADGAYDMVILATPVAALRTALSDNRVAFSEETVVVSCSKGIEQETCLLPHQIFASLGVPGRYYALAGPSFAHEIMEHVPTVVDIAGVATDADIPDIRSVLATDYFKLEQHDSVLEIELAGAMKNVYAVAAGFLAGLGGGANTHAHLQVVALREYQALASSLEGTGDVVRPSIVGDLQLTSGSKESRNYRYGHVRAEGGDMPDETVEGRNTIRPLLAIAERAGVELPLAQSVLAIIEHGADAREVAYRALGF